MEAIPLQNEIKHALWSIGIIKSPGPDVYAAISEAFRNAKHLKQLNATFVALIPKVVKPTRVQELRAISCCNSAQDGD